MQRRQESEFREQLEKEQQRINDEAHWVLPVPENLRSSLHSNTLDNIEVVNSITDVVEVVPGRQSFKSFNVDIEVRKLFFQCFLSLCLLFIRVERIKEFFFLFLSFSLYHTHTHTFLLISSSSF